MIRKGMSRTDQVSYLSLHDALPIWRSGSVTSMGSTATAPHPRPTVVPSARSKTSRQVAVAKAGMFQTWSPPRSEEHTSELQSQSNIVCRLLLEKKKIQGCFERW